MAPHPYLRAYLAGIALPTVMLLVLLAVVVAAHLGPGIPVERLLVFPMAVVPNVWGLWNMLYVALRPRRWPLGLHGAVLPLLLMPAGLLLAHALEIRLFAASRVAVVLTVLVAFYYLVWKHVVGFLNRLLEVQP